MKTITIDDVLTSGYCKRYNDRIIRRLWGDRETATALDILDAELVPLADSVWLVLKVDMLGDEALYTFRATLAHYCADIYERYYPDDDRVRKCAEAWHLAAQGEPSGLDAARDAAFGAAFGAASGAARDSAFGAAFDAARAAVRGADMYVELDDILTWLRDIVEVYEL